MDFIGSDLGELGELTRLGANHGEDITCVLPASTREVLVVALERAASALTLPEGFALITAHWHAVGEMSPASQAKLAEVLAHATYRAERCGVTTWADLDEVACAKFIHSPLRSSQEPSVSTMHLRRSTLRIGFTTLRHLGHHDGDPTLDIALPARSQLAARAATDDEMMLLRMNAVASRPSRQPAVLAHRNDRDDQRDPPTRTRKRR